MSTKVSIALTEAEDAELEAQARTIGKTKTAIAGEHFRAGLSNGTSTIKAIQEVQAKLRLSNHELNLARRTILNTELDPEEREYRVRRGRELAAETAQDPGPDAVEDGIQA